MDSTSTKNILIIDDDPDDISLLRKAIHEVMPNAKISEMDSSSKAINFLYKKDLKAGELPATIFLDIHMGILDGKAILNLIKVDRKLNGIHVIVLSGRVNEDISKELISLGANDFYIKPGTYSELVEIVRSAKSKGHFNKKAT